MRLRRELLSTYILVAVGLGAGAAYGAFGPGEPAPMRWLFGLGVGLTGGAFIAANVSGVQLLGGGPGAGGSDFGPPGGGHSTDDSDGDAPPGAPLTGDRPVSVPTVGGHTRNGHGPSPARPEHEPTERRS